MSEAIAVDPSMMPVVFACDVGSVSAGACHWVMHRDGDDSRDSGDLAALVDAIVAALAAGDRVALGIECPLFVPCPEDGRRLGAPRDGDVIPGVGNRSFKLGPAACATAEGVPILAWTLAAVRDRAPRTRGTTDVAAFARGDADLLVWEAFVTGPAKGPHHRDDARVAADAFAARWQSGTMRSDGDAPRPLSLAAAALLWSGLSDDVGLLRRPCLIVRPTMAAANDVEVADVPVRSVPPGTALHRENDWSLFWLRPDPTASSFDAGTGYALSIDGAALAPKLMSYARLMRAAQRKDGSFGGAFRHLRIALYFIQRSVRNTEASRVDVEGRADFVACHAALCKAWSREAKWHLHDAMAADAEARARLAAASTF